MANDVFVVIEGGRNTQEVVESGWKDLVAGFRTALERMRAQPKYPAIPDDEME
jgi:hypothetical protein